VTLSRLLTRAIARGDGACAVDPDSDIIDLVARGDTDAAVRCVMRRYGVALYRYCRAGLGDAALAEDVQQQVFVEVHRDLPRFTRRSRLKIWLFAIARHRVYDAAKRRRRARRHVADDADDVDAVDPRPSAAESVDEARLRAALVDCLAALPDATRAALLLRYQQGFSFAEMAAICGERPSTLCARISRVLPRLRRDIESRIGPL